MLDYIHLDDQNREILSLMQKNARITNSEIAEKLRLSVPAVAARIKKLESEKIILGHKTILDPLRLGLGITAFIHVSIEDPVVFPDFIEKMVSLPEIQECHHVVGESDCILKVRTKNTLTLEELILKKIRSIKGIGHTKTSIVLSCAKESTEYAVKETRSII